MWNNSVIYMEREHVSYNVHSLIHLVDDCRVYGVLDNFSAFTFENSFQSLKRKFKKKMLFLLNYIIVNLKIVQQVLWVLI